MWWNAQELPEKAACSIQRGLTQYFFNVIREMPTMFKRIEAITIQNPIVEAATAKSRMPHNKHKTPKIKRIRPTILTWETDFIV